MILLLGVLSLKKNESHNSSVNVGSKNKFGGDTAIGNRAKIIKKNYVQDNSIRYDGEKIDVTNIEKLSVFITSRFDEKKATKWSVLSGLGGLVGIIFFVNSIFTGELKLIKYLPKFGFNIGLTGMIISSLLFLAGIIVYSAINYKYESQCPKCGKHYAYKPVGVPKVREVDARDGTKRTETQLYRCENCGHRDKKSETITLPYEESE